MELVTVPQFIDSEDKIMGPITVRQFVIMLVTAGLLFVVYKLTDLGLFIIAAIFIVGTGALFAFYRVNGQPFHFFLLHVVQTVKNPSLRVWKKVPPTRTRRDEEFGGKDIQLPIDPLHQLSAQRLSDLALIVDTGGAYRGENEEGELFS